MASNPLIYKGSVSGLATASCDIYDNAGANQGNVALTEVGSTAVYEATNAQLLTGVGGTLAAGLWAVHFKEGSSVMDVGASRSG